MPKFSNRQKAIAAAIVIVVVIIVWQGMNLMGGGETKITPAAKVTPGKTTAIATTPPSAATTSTTAALSQNAAAQIQPKAAPVTGGELEIFRQQREAQEKYISTLNELQLLKVQRDIAETNQAIATSKLATVTAEKNMNDILTRPAYPTATASYGNKLMTGVPPGAIPSSTENIPPPPVAEIPYVAISVSQALGKWQAVLSVGGKFYTVSVGDVLPMDGSRVTSIGRGGVTLRRDSETRKISIVPAI